MDGIHMVIKCGLMFLEIRGSVHGRKHFLYCSAFREYFTSLQFSLFADINPPKINQYTWLHCF